MRVRFIKATEAYALRLLVLRPGGVEADVHFANDRLEGAFHLGVLRADDLIGVGSFYPEAHPALKGWKQYRLRGMAVHPDHQRQGAGDLLLRFGMDHLKTQHADLLWCNARLTAVPFYARLGLEVQGAAFDIPGIGLHQVMSRRI